MTRKNGVLEVVPARAVAGSGAIGTPKRMPKRLRLSTLDDVEVELRRLYAAARNGEVATQDATRLCYVLKTLSEVIAERTIEQRLDEIEQRLT